MAGLNVRFALLSMALVGSLEASQASSPPQTAAPRALPRAAQAASAAPRPAAKSGNPGPTATAAPARGLIMVADFGGRIRLMDPAANTIAYDYDFTKEPAEDCTRTGVTCGVIGAGYTSYNDDDYLDMAMWIYDLRPRSSKIDRFHSVIQRMRPTTPATTVWKIRDLDFTHALDGASYCTQDAANPANHSDPRCRPKLVHSIQVVDDQPQNKRVTVVLADLMNLRVEQVTLDYSSGSTLGRVDWVLGETNADWPEGANPNAVQLINNQPGGPYLLTTFYTTAEQSHGSHLIMWQWRNGQWLKAWGFPEDTPEAPAMLNTPHMGEVIIDPVTSRPLISYNHSRGLAGSWDTFEDYAGSYGLLTTGPTLADKPTYIMDAVVHGNDEALETHFSRDVDFLPDGSMLLTDAACESGACANPSRLFRVTPYFRSAPPSTKPGNYTLDHSQVEKFNIPDGNVLEEFQCGFQVLFEAEWIQSTQVGKTLRNAAARPVGACPAPQ